MSLIHSSLLLGAGAAAGGYQIERSIRFNSSDSASLSRASYAGSGTFSCWVKRCKLGTAQTIISGVAFNASDQLNSSTAVFRDPSAWMHVLVSTSGTYVNGTSVASGSAITPGIIGSGCDLYLADIHFIDGQALTPSSFTEVSATTGQLIPKAYTGTFTGNSFWLKFSDNSSTTSGSNVGIGKDFSGLGNYWNSTGLSVTAGAGNDSLVDTPTSSGTDTGVGGQVAGNYATLNPLDNSPAGLSNGNLDASSANAYPTIIPGSGSWYYEVNGTGYSWDGTRSNWTPRAGSHNFGQRAFSSTAPSGFKALCDTNLPAPVVAKSASAFDVKLYTGNGSTNNITGLNFSPDLVWIKARSQPYSNTVFDVIRGATNYLYTDTTGAEGTGAQFLTAFNSDGFSLGTNAAVNQSSTTYAAWTWDAGTSTVTNTQGSITSSVRANASAGFSIVTYTGTGSVATVGHGLGAAPSLIITKSRNNAYNWTVYHSSLGINQYLWLDSLAAASGSSGYWNTAPTSTIFGVANNNTGSSGSNIVAYCFAPVTGYSSVGSYVGNGSTDGVFVYTGFKVRWLMVKATSVGSWRLYDTSRSPYNVAAESLYANLSDSEATIYTGEYADLLSNGFKMRGNGSASNNNGTTYIYFAVAENPFQFSRAR